MKGSSSRRKRTADYRKQGWKAQKDRRRVRKMGGEKVLLRLCQAFVEVRKEHTVKAKKAHTIAASIVRVKNEKKVKSLLSAAVQEGYVVRAGQAFKIKQKGYDFVARAEARKSTKSEAGDALCTPNAV